MQRPLGAYCCQLYTRTYTLVTSSFDRRKSEQEPKSEHLRKRRHETDHFPAVGCAESLDRYSVDSAGRRAARLSHVHSLYERDGHAECARTHDVGLHPDLAAERGQFGSERVQTGVAESDHRHHRQSAGTPIQGEYCRPSLRRPMQFTRFHRCDLDNKQSNVLLP